MSTWKPDLEIPSPIRYRCNNEGVVTAGYYKRVASAINHCVAYRRKTICSYSQDPNNLQNGVSGNGLVWYAYFHTGHGVDTIEVKITYAVCNDASATAPVVGASLVSIAGATVDSVDYIYTGIIDTSVVDAAATLRSFTGYLAAEPDTSYYVQCGYSDYARIQAFEAHELGAVPVDDTGTCGVDPRVSIGGQITATRQGAFGQAVDELLRTNRAQLFSWCVYNGTTTITSTTYTNVLDGTSTSVTAATPGWYIRNRYHNTASRTDVPVRLAVYAYRSAGSGSAKCKVTDGSNEVEITGITNTWQWYTADDTIPAATNPTKFDALAAVGTGGDSLEIYAICLLEYE